MAWVPPGVNRLATARSSFLPTMEATALASRSWAALMSLAVLGGLVEAGAGPGIGQVASDAEPLQAVERLLGLGERQQDRAVVAHVHHVMRRQRVAGLDGLQRRLAHGAQAEDDARRDGRFAVALGRGDGERAERQRFELAGVFLEEAGEVDAEVVQREVGDGDAAATGLRGR